MTKIFYLYPRSGHTTPLRSDTLWGGICWGIRFLYGEKKLSDILDAYTKGHGPFFITSTFPFRSYKGEKNCFFPTPLIAKIDPNEAGQNNSQVYRHRKKMKKLNYVNLSQFNKIINGALDFNDLLSEVIDSSSAETGPSLQYQIANIPPVRKSYTITKNAIDRISQGTLQRKSLDGRDSGQLFHVSETHLIDPVQFSSKKKQANDRAQAEAFGAETDIGLFFLAKGETEYIEAALRFFRHHGMGGDRSTGKGFFDFKVEAFPGFDEPSDPDSTVNLSIYQPTPQEVHSFKNVRYSLQEVELRQGRLGTIRANRIKPPRATFKEGSVFPWHDGNNTIWGTNQRWRLEGVSFEGQDYGMGWMVKMKTPAIWK